MFDQAFDTTYRSCALLSIPIGLEEVVGAHWYSFFSPGYIYGDFCRSSGDVAMLDAGLLVAAYRVDIPERLAAGLQFIITSKFHMEPT